MRNTSLTSSLLNLRLRHFQPGAVSSAATRARGADANAQYQLRTPESRLSQRNSRPATHKAPLPHDISAANSTPLAAPFRSSQHALDRRADTNRWTLVTLLRPPRHHRRAATAVDRRATGAKRNCARRPGETRSAPHALDQTRGPRASGTETLPASRLQQPVSTRSFAARSDRRPAGVA